MSLRALWLVPLAAASVAQQPTATQESELTAAARREAERRQKSTGKKQSYGDQDLPRASPAPSPTPTSPTAIYVAVPTDDRLVRQEALWRERARDARSQVAAAQAQLDANRQSIDDLRAKLNPMSLSFTTDTNEQLQAQAGIAAIEEQQPPLLQALATAQAALRQLEKDARSQGVSASWLEPAEAKR